MKKTQSSCELCSSEAKMYCESDQAILCWDCDDKVHGANFLVAKHTRAVLCHVCQSHTPWKAAGQSLGSIVSVCSGCVRENKKSELGGETVAVAAVVNEVVEDDVDDDCGYDDDDDDVKDEKEEEEEDEEDSCSDYYEEDEDEDDENQVVPRRSTPPPPAVASTSSSGEEEES